MIIVILLLFSFFIGTKAQDCEAYFPMKEGAKFEMSSYNAKGKLLSSTKQTVLNRTVTGDDIEYKVNVEYFDAKGKPTLENSYIVKCEDSVFKIDMSLFLDNEALKNIQGMEVTVDGDYLDMPSSLLVGQTLNDGTLNVTVGMNGMTLMKMYVHVTNRKVEAIEDITTSAGTFECYKLSFDVETKFGIKIKTSAIEWVAKNVGVVRSESYNKSGKLNGYTELTKLKN